MYDLLLSFSLFPGVAISKLLTIAHSQGVYPPDQIFDPYQAIIENQYLTGVLHEL